MRYGKALRSLLTVGLSLWTVQAYAQTPAVTFDTSSGSPGANQTQSVGWLFNVTSPVTVTALSWFDDGANGLSLAHDVGIYDPSGTLLTSVTIPAGTVAPLDSGGFRTVSVAPLTLAVGNGYIVGGQNFARSTDALLFNVSGLTTQPGIVFDDATFSNINAGVLERPTNHSVAVNGFFGPSFDLGSAVPEPGTMALLAGLGFSSLVAVRRMRRRNR